MEEAAAIRGQLVVMEVIRVFQIISSQILIAIMVNQVRMDY